MTERDEHPDGDALRLDLPDDPDERAAEARRVADRLRRRKRALERRNPLNDLDGYRERFRELVALEAELRRLREAPDGSAPA